MPKPRKPVELIKLQGGYQPVRHDERAKTSDAYPVGTPEPPEWLSPRASEAWTFVCGLLSPIGVIRPTDALALEVLCSTYAEWREAQGSEMGPREVDMIRSALMRQLTEFGLTPVSRQKVSATKDKIEQDPWAELKRSSK